jgi:hypothetical protein
MTVDLVMMVPSYFHCCDVKETKVAVVLVGGSRTLVASHVENHSPKMDILLSETHTYIKKRLFSIVNINFMIICMIKKPDSESILEGFGDDTGTPLLTST